MLQYIVAIFFSSLQARDSSRSYPLSSSSENCTSKSVLVNTLKRRDKLFIYPNNAHPLKHGNTYTTTEYYSCRRIWNGRCDIRHDGVLLEGEKENEDGLDDGIRKRGGWNKKEKNVCCTLYGGFWSAGRTCDEEVGEWDDSIRGWHLNGDVLYVDGRAVRTITRKLRPFPRLRETKVAKREIYQKILALFLVKTL